LRREENGAAVTLAIFTIFVILCSVLALHTFEAGYQRQLSMVQQRMATDSTRAVAATVESELNYALRLAVEAAMYEVGRDPKLNENRSNIDIRILAYFENRIQAGWSYSNFDKIYVESVYAALEDNRFRLTWLPDGSLRASGYLDATFSHVMGARAYGVKLDAGVVPRYGRMENVARSVFNEYYEDGALKMGHDPDNLREELDNNYACELLHFDIRQSGLTVYDDYAGRVIAA
jgi:hypothetical protein